MDEIRARITGICLELESVLLEDKPERKMFHINEARKLIERLDYIVWHSHHTSGIPYTPSATDNWK